MIEGEKDSIFTWFLDDGSITGKLPGIFNFFSSFMHLPFCLSHVE